MDCPQAVVFDFDYTLADSSRAVVACVAAAFEAMGLPAAAWDDIRRTIGLSLPDTLARLAGEEVRPRAEEFRAHFRRRSDQVMADWTELLPGARSCIERLRGRGMKLAIVSTKFRFRIEDTLRREALAGSFATIIGGDDVTFCKPDPRGLLLAAERLEVDPCEVLYVGDSVTDAETARSAGVPFAAVLSGMTASGEFDVFDPLAVLDSVGELPEFLDKGFPGNASLDDASSAGGQRFR